MQLPSLIWAKSQASTRGEDVAAEDAGILHGRIEKALPGAATAHDQVHALQVKQEPGHQAGLNVLQLGRLKALLHADVEHLVASAFEGRDDGRLRSAALVSLITAIFMSLLMLSASPQSAQRRRCRIQAVRGAF